MSKPKQSSDENTASGLLSQLIREAEAEARAYLPPPPKNVKPIPSRKNDVTIVRANGTREIARGAASERVVPFDPDVSVSHIPRDALLKPVPTDAAVKLDKYWRSFQIPNAYLSDGTNSKIAIHLLATCLLVQNEPKLSSHQLLVVGHNIGVLRMMLRMYSDQKKIESHRGGAADNRASRRALELFSEYEKKYPQEHLNSDKPNASTIVGRVIKQLELEDYGLRNRTVLLRLRQRAAPTRDTMRGRRKI